MKTSRRGLQALVESSSPPPRPVDLIAQAVHPPLRCSLSRHALSHAEALPAISAEVVYRVDLVLTEERKFVTCLCVGARVGEGDRPCGRCFPFDIRGLAGNWLTKYSGLRRRGTRVYSIQIATPWIYSLNSYLSEAVLPVNKVGGTIVVALHGCCQSKYIFTKEKANFMYMPLLSSRAGLIKKSTPSKSGTIRPALLSSAS
ncbi:hypothetical protein TESG_06535 [Trichophyton tonsurans CBS 112818]|uniref:Uncharacterized protein n=1 Tax=Trichophyton tonsurans (strain CBS 112818) TaxID=647933 RepID=F2S6R7_TRIT1|nr:hypothetical protein TESG_06535 [Trichophyton tonsurans CBS 112818]